MGEMETMDSVSEKECHSLAGLFQQIAKDSKAGLPLFDELLIKTKKLQVQIKAAMSILVSFLDTFQKIADNASNTKGSSRDIGICLTRVILRHRALEKQINAYSSSLLSSLLVPMRSKTVEWKKVVNSLDKEHSKEFNRSRKSIKRKIEYIMKLKKKAGKAPGPQLGKLIEQAAQDLHVKYKVLEEQEQQAVRRINSQERSHYCSLAACLKPVIAEEYNMTGEIQKLDEVMDKLGRVTADPHNVQDTADQVIRDMKAAGEAFGFITPPSTPGIGSRRGSIRSLNSLASSRASSSASLQNEKESSLTRDGNYGISVNNCASRRKPLERSERYSGNSYRSKESEDISFHRPGSALSNMSKDSEEGHGRSRSRQGHVKDLTPIFSTVRRASSPLRRPPLPAPPSDCEKVTRRPPLPHRYQQDKATGHQKEEGRRSELPEKIKQDGQTEVTPQPVYSNTAEAKASANTEESQNGSCLDEEIKTPTTEEGAKLEEGSTTSSNRSIGSSSGYGSQLTVLRVEDPLHAVLQSLENGFDGNENNQSTYTKFSTFNKTTCAPSRSSSFNQADATLPPIGESIPISIRRKSTSFANKPHLPSLNIPQSSEQENIQRNASQKSWQIPRQDMVSPKPWDIPSPNKITLEPWNLPVPSSTASEPWMLPSPGKMSSPPRSLPDNTFPEPSDPPSFGKISPQPRNLSSDKVSPQLRSQSYPHQVSLEPCSQPTPNKDAYQPWGLQFLDKVSLLPLSLPTSDKVSPQPWNLPSSGKVYTTSWSLPCPNKVYNTSSPQPWRLPRSDIEEASFAGFNESFPPPLPHLLSLQDPESLSDPPPIEITKSLKASPEANVQSLRRSLSIGANAPSSSIHRNDPHYRSVTSVSRIPSTPGTIKRLPSSQATQSANLIKALNDRLKTQIPHPAANKIQSKTARPLYDRINQCSGIPAPKFGPDATNSSRINQSRCVNPISRK